MSTYQVPGIAPNDFTTDFEDLLINFLYTKWTITNPEKGVTPTSLSAKVNFRPGFPNYSVPYEVLSLQTATRVAERNDPYSWHMFTQMEIRIVSKEITRDNVAPQLGNMERHIEKIINLYESDEIPGIQDIIFLGRERDYGGSNRSATSGKQTQVARTASGSWNTSTWESITFCELSYYKERV